MMQGLSDAMLDKVEDDRALLIKYGPLVNDLLSSRAVAIGDKQKKKGEEFVTKYLLSNPKAIKTSSGLVFHEKLAGIGKQVIFQICSS